MNYSIIAYNRDQKSCHYKNWAVKTSDDGSNWTKIDENSNYDKLKGSNFDKTFNTKPKNFSQFVQIPQTGDYFGIFLFYLILNQLIFRVS